MHRRRRDHFILATLVAAAIAGYAWHPAAGGALIAAAGVFAWARGL